MLEHLTPENASYDGIVSVKIGSNIYKCDEIVVVGGHIGNIERVDLEKEECQLGLSFTYDNCMEDPEDWEMYSGYICSYKDIRHANEQEVMNYDISSGLCCDTAEAADRAWKERWEKNFII